MSQIALPGYTAELYASIVERPCRSRKPRTPRGKASHSHCSIVLTAQNSNGIDSTVALLSFGMKWMYRLVVFGSRWPTNAAVGRVVHLPHAVVEASAGPPRGTRHPLGGRSAK
jgi:hypothetical protein